MKPKHYIPFILIALIAVFFIGKCSNSPETPVSSKPVFNRDSAMKVVREEVEELAILHKISESKEKPAIEYRDRWHKAKHDTVGVPYLQIINTCDSVIVKDTAYENALCDELEQAYSVIKAQSDVIVGDSLNYAARGDTIALLSKEVKKQKWQKRGILAAWGLREGLGLINR